MRFGIRLVPLREFALVSYPLTSDEEEQIINDTKGLNHKQTINYALDAVRKLLSYNIYPSEESEASCVGFASMFTSVANLGFQANSISAYAITVEGTGKFSV